MHRTLYLFFAGDIDPRDGCAKLVLSGSISQRSQLEDPSLAKSAVEGFDA